MENQTYSPAPAPLPAPPARPGKGLAVTALVLGIVALALCWVPVLNNVFLFVGLAGLGFGIAALVTAAKRRAPKGMPIAGLILSVLSIIGVFATQAVYSAALDSVVESIEDSADGVVAADPEQTEAAADSLAVGTSAEIGEYTVTVTGVNLNANDQVVAANQFNAAPAGQYVLVDMAVVYNGAEEGDPWVDLTAELAGSDARQYSTSTCTAVAPNPAHEVPTLTKGGAGSYSVCFDVPAEAITDAKILVESLFSFRDDRVYWAAQ
ncbi:DUF4190 domain-containing protein [Arthrobacter gandavensis]|uniref:DUF4190 domain-containing protein n=1 Tax=Arthrobacter gandavensis TaxID=169960 RepID=UPI00188E5736|nr:DUF4190 domain-containing protein [Arthrobacter gandavensis]MBF4993331.1 DUF4190 domain-containing protein [Arthrobacter gandavensis]